MKLLYRIPVAAEALSVSRAKMYQMVKAGEINAVQLDGEMRITSDELQRYVRSLEDRAGGSNP